MKNFADDADRWEEFKKLLSQEDKANLESVLKKAKTNEDKDVDFNTN